MSAFTVSAVAAPRAARFASRDATAVCPAKSPARLVRRAGRVAQTVVAKAGPSGTVKKVRPEAPIETGLASSDLHDLVSIHPP